jgi:hypothetical protein
MGISYAPSIAQQLGGPEALNQLGEGISHLINPNYKFQQAMRARIATDPKLAQELADQEYANPGMLKSIGLGGLGEEIAKLPESPDAATIRTHREQILGIKGGELDTKSAQTKTESNIAKGAAEKTTPGSPGYDADATTDAILKSIGLPTKAQSREQSAKASEEEFNVAVNNIVGPQAIGDAQIAKYKNEILKANYDRSNLEQIIKDEPQLKNIDIMQVIKNMRGGKPVSPLIQEFMMTPKGQNVLALANTALGSQERLDNQLMMERENNLNRAERASNRVDDKLQYEAAQQVYKTGAGSQKAWYIAATQPGAIKAAQAKLESGATLNQDELDLIAVGDKQKEQLTTATDKATLIKAKATSIDLNKSLQAINNALNPGGTKQPAAESIVQGLVGTYNQQLAAKNKVSGRNIVAKYGPVPDVGESKAGFKYTITNPVTGAGISFGQQDKGLYYTEGGKRISDEDGGNYIKTDIINPSSSSPTPAGQTQNLSSAAQKLLDSWNNTDQATRERLRPQLVDDPAYKELISKGVIK